MQRKYFVASIFVGLQVAVASAGLWETIYRGVDIAATPIGSTSRTSDGFAINGQRNGRVRIVPNDLGNGYRLEFDRNFGLDSAGRPEVFDAGAGELQLSGRVQATGQYTTRGFLIGSADVSMQNLNYSFRGKTGAQDIEYSGTMNLQGNLEVNRLGFYTYNLTASNTNSTLKVDGVVAQDQKTTNFDVGPIAVKGNIFIDGLTSLLSSVGVKVPDLGPLNNQSLGEQVASSIQNQVANAGVVAGEQATNEIDSALAAINGQIISTALSGSSPDQSTIDSLLAIVAADVTLNADGTTDSSSRVPEPGTMVLLAIGVACVIRRR